MAMRSFGLGASAVQARLTAGWRSRRAAQTRGLNAIRRVDKSAETYGSLYRVQAALGLPGVITAALLLELLARPDTVHTREALAEAAGCATKSVTVFMCRLRLRLAELGVEDAIETVRGLGYALSARNALKLQRRGFR